MKTLLTILTGVAALFLAGCEHFDHHDHGDHDDGHHGKHHHGDHH